MIERAEFKERCGVRLDQASVPQSDQRQQETDSGSRSQSQPRGNGHRDLLAKRRGGHDEKQHACPEHDAERRRPRYLLLQHDRECEECVEPHARRDGEWEPRVESHQQRHRTRQEHGRRQHPGEAHPGALRREDSRIHDDDVRHREEGGDAADDVARDARLVARGWWLVVVLRSGSGRTALHLGYSRLSTPKSQLPIPNVNREP